MSLPFLLILLIAAVDRGCNEEFSVDGGWSSWGAWGPCSGECGYSGRKLRSRNCNNPPASGRGSPCIGSPNEIVTCQITGCTMQKYEDVLHSDIVRKQELNVIKLIHQQIPALIDLCFLSNCAFSIVEKILRKDAMIYWNAMNCVKNRVGCPVSGGWGSWESWSPCNAACGRGQRYRKRSCDNPKPSDPELNCDGPTLQLEKCIGINCVKSLSGTWGPWSSWSSCNVPCGSGIRSRGRICTEALNRNDKFSKEDTSCEGPSKEMEACEIIDCSMDGQWSAWTGWSSCSSNCGVGLKSRNRMCNNPSPSGSGASCLGPPSDIQACYTIPCSAMTHKVAVFSGGSSLLYPARGSRMRLLHVYIRFLPLASSGTLLHRYPEDCRESSSCDRVTLALENSKLTLSLKISSFALLIDSEGKLEIGRWHEVLTMIAPTRGSLRVDNGNHKIFSLPRESSFNFDYKMELGNRFYGQIEKVAINFKPVQLHLLRSNLEYESDYVPFRSIYVDYSMGNNEEGYLRIAATESGSISCPKRNEYWSIRMAVKPEGASGIIATIPSDTLNNYILLILEEERIKLYLRQNSLQTFVESAEYATTGSWLEVLIVRDDQKFYFQVNGGQKHYLSPISEKILLTCSNYVFIGSVDEEIKRNICPECDKVPQMSFTLGLLTMDESQLDLHSIFVKEVTSNQFSSRTISFSDYYEEISVPIGRELKLSCFYNRSPDRRERYIAWFKENVIWLLMDKPLISNGNKIDLYTVKTNGRVSSISATSYESPDLIEGFYTCQVKRFGEKPILNLYTFGVTVIDESEELQHLSLKEWVSICIIIVILTIPIILWSIAEALSEFRNSFQTVSDDEDLSSMLKYLHSKDAEILLGNRENANKIIFKLKSQEVQSKNFD